MILALLVLACLGATAFAAAAVRRAGWSAWLAVPLVTGVPLLAWLALQATVNEARSPFEFRVLGQYHRLADTLLVGTPGAGRRSEARVVLEETSLPATDLRVSYAGGADSVHVRVARSALPVLLGGAPVNAVRLDRRARVARGGEAIEIVRPWYCIRCDARVVRPAAGTRYEVRLSPAVALPLAGDSVVLFRWRGRTYVAADPGAGITVDDTPVPDRLTARSDSLRVGVPARVVLYVRAAAAEHALEVRFGEPGPGGSWSLPAGDSALRLLVAATTGAPAPGVMRVLNPGGVAPGGADPPYGGVLQQHAGGWEWQSNGATRPFVLDADERLPGEGSGRTSGHIVQLRQTDTHPGAARAAVVLAWLAGALALAWAMRLLHPEALALRVLLLGSVYTLVSVRATLAFRAWLAPPHDANSPITLLVLLLALPALTGLLHAWQATSNGLLPRTRLGRELLFGMAPVGAAGFAVSALVLPGWRLEIMRAAAAAVLVGAGGLLLLNRLLVTAVRADRPGEAPQRAAAAARRAEPLAVVAAPPAEQYTQRQFLAAVALLGVLAFLLLVVTELVQHGTLLALLGWGAIMGVVLLATSSPRVLIRPRYAGLGERLALAAGLGAAVLTLLLGRGPVLAGLALAAVGGSTFVLARRSRLALRPVRLRELLATPLLIGMLATLVAVLFPELVTSGRVLAEYALALAGLLVIARIFAMLWFRQAQQLAARRQGAKPHAPRALAVGAVLLLLVAAIYTPLALFDSGLVLLFFAATVTVVCAGFFMIGARVLAGGIAVAVVLAFAAGMFVRRADLLDGSASLSTAQVRYAATYHPDALQRHLLAAADGRPTTTVRTLQQYWGMRYFAAGGTTGQGYFGADYADWIVPRPVALTENVFSTFVLSEHGWLGAVAVLLCYLAMALALWYGAWRTGARLEAAPRALLLVGIGAFWIVPAFYIAAANGVLVPLTGQNMAMLGLLSAADAALASWLAALGLLALPVLGESGAEHVRSGGWTRRLRTAVSALGVVFSAGYLVLGALLWRPAHASVGSFRLDGVIADVEALVAQGALVAAAADPDTVAVAVAGERHPLLRPGGFLRQRVRRANEMARGAAGGAGCLDSDPLVRARADGSVAVFAALCGLRSVVEGRRDWQGALLAASPAAGFAITDGRTSVLLDSRSGQDARLGAGCARAGVVSARSVRLGCAADAPQLRFGTTAPVLEPGGAQVRTVGVDGQEPGRALLNGLAAETTTLLADGDHVRVPGSLDGWVLAIPRGAVSYPRWENGATRRVHSPGLQPWLAQVDSQLARGLSAAERAAWDVVTTIRPGLQARLHDAVAEACAASPGVRRCSALIADPFTGEVLAFTATFTQPHRYLPTDANLRNHPAASTIKPVLAAAAVHAFPRLRTLQVEHHGAEYSVIANTPVRPPVRAPRLFPSPLVTWQGFLGASDNLYATTLGFLAASDRSAEGLPRLRGDADQSPMRLDGRALRGTPSWRSGALELQATPIAASLETLFGVRAAAADAPPYDRAFWSAAIGAGALVESGDVQRITPEPVLLGMDRIDSPRQYAAFLLGGGSNRWNNLALVQAFSRVFTGRAVQLHVLRAVGPHDVTPGAPDSPELAGPRAAVLSGLDAVVNQPWGTGHSLRGTFPPKVDWRAKTGTLREREWNGSVLLWAGGGARGVAEVCAAAGILTLEMADGASPDGRATALFREAIAPLLQQELGWGAHGCVQPPPATVPE